MTPREFWQSNADDVLKATAKAAGTTADNLKQIALYKGSCSARLARRLAAASNGAMTLEEILFSSESEGAA